MKTKFLFLSLILLIAGSAVFGQEKIKTMRANTEPVRVGEIAPDFTLTDADGKTVQLSRIKSPAVLVFYRGYWCPYCLRQLAELRSLMTPKDKTPLYAISIDPADKLKVTREKIAKDGKGEINFPLLSDPGHKTIDAYGVFDPAYTGQRFEGIPHPAVYILDKNRKVVYSKVEPDYKLRPTNEDIRAELDKLK
ncbi:MAG: peroxiredoxin family protein [Pyrinomonadaceae bacterium]